MDNMVQLDYIIEKLNALFAIGEYENAEKLIASARKVPSLYNDTVAIYDANIAMSKGDFTGMWNAIKRGLEINPQNYELYVMLGEYYLEKNPNQAYLCFENALLYCNNEADCEQIKALIEGLKKENDIRVNNVSFVILSYNTLDFTKTCIESIRENTLESSREIVIVDNNSTDGSLEWLEQQTDIVLRANKENSGFPKGCNQGLEVSRPENDIFLLNNDTLLPPNALFWLRMGLYENDEVGATSCLTNFASNLQALNFEDSSRENLLDFARKTNLPMEHPYEEKVYLVGFALLIKRSVYDKVGDLDERFTPGNYEDNDYGVRVLQAGYKNILCRNSFILHFGSKSFGKKAEAYNKLLQTNSKKFEEKWSFRALLYLYPKLEYVELVKAEKEDAIKILEIGCGCGATGAYLKGKYPNATTYGIEVNANAEEIARTISQTICGDVKTMEFPWEDNFFDYVIIDTELIHIHNLADVLKRLYKHIKVGGYVIVAGRNIKHYSVILPLLANDISPNSVVHGKDVRMYTRVELMNTLVMTGYTPERLHVTQAGTPSEEESKCIELLQNMSETKEPLEYFAYKYIVKAKK